MIYLSHTKKAWSIFIGQAFNIPNDYYVANLSATFTPCELASFEAVLRTVFCLRQNARGAIFAASLTNEFVDSALLDYHDCRAIISLIPQE